MVQLRSYYSLCPLIDRKSFLGVSEDSESGCGIITLGKNVVNRYKVSVYKFNIVLFVKVNRKQVSYEYFTAFKTTTFINILKFIHRLYDYFCVFLLALRSETDRWLDV